MSPSDRRLRVVRAVALGCLVGFSVSCAETALRETVLPTRYDIPPPPEPLPAENGAIWPGGTSGGSFLYFDRKARGLGDLVTVVVNENLSANGEASTDVEKSSSLGVDLESDVGLGELAVLGFETLLGIFGIDLDDADGTANLNVVQTNASNGYQGDGSTSRSGSFTGTVTCRVVEVLPGGMFRVFGKRQIVVNHDLQLVTIEGFVRREDIGIDNQVPSSVLADLRLTYDGIGVIDDKQRPSLLARWFDLFYPF